MQNEQWPLTHAQLADAMWAKQNYRVHSTSEDIIWFFYNALEFNNEDVMLAHLLSEAIHPMVAAMKRELGLYHF